MSYQDAFIPLADNLRLHAWVFRPPTGNGPFPASTSPAVIPAGPGPSPVSVTSISSPERA